MDIGALLLDIGQTTLELLWKMAYIMIPIIILMEVLIDAGLLEKISHKLRGVTKLFKLPEQISFGMIIAIFVGLLYGSGVISRLLEDVRMSRKQLNTLFIFVGVCHAVFEETALFAAAGANVVVIMVSRVVLGVLFALGYLMAGRKKSGDTLEISGNDGGVGHET